MSVYVGSLSGVVQLPLSNCRRYTSCYDCIFSRDPHCAWNGAQCVDVMAQADRWVLRVFACVCVCLCVIGWVIKVLQVPFCVFDWTKFTAPCHRVSSQNCCIIKRLTET